MTLTNLTSGLIGSALGAVFTFFAAVGTLLWTRNHDRHREVVRLQERDHEQRRADVARVIGTLRALELESRLFPLWAARSTARLLEATMRFYLGAHDSHPAVAEWLLEQHDQYQDAVDRWHRHWWRLWSHTKRARAAAQLLGEIVVVLVQWASGNLNDDDFSGPHVPAGELAKLGARRHNTQSKTSVDKVTL